ncbi:hypothetical protein [Oscillatoria sp. HE19RPO]|uniref:hypothetical protein n=1 Tax=Oscillatoria sp. HE19RPO TaxID=2954806 RepID=UPI0020C3A2E4|nr:hypothetical protein [Oscillatoria sp. HE19RPO]
MDINLIKEIIRQICGNYLIWVRYSEICGVLKKEYEISVDQDFFLDNNYEFRIYQRCEPNDFYIALAENLPYQRSSPQHSPNMHSYRRPRSTRAIPPKIKTRQDNILEVYGIDDTEEDKVFQEIKTAADFQQVIGKIIKKLARESNQPAIDFEQIGKEFSTLYQQPIRPSLRPYNLKLIDILQSLEFITVDSPRVFLKKKEF